MRVSNRASVRACPRPSRSWAAPSPAPSSNARTQNMVPCQVPGAPPTCEYRAGTGKAFLACRIPLSVTAPKICWELQSKSSSSGATGSGHLVGSDSTAISCSALESTARRLVRKRLQFGEACLHRVDPCFTDVALPSSDRYSTTLDFGNDAIARISAHENPSLVVLLAARHHEAGAFSSRGPSVDGPEADRVPAPVDAPRPIRNS